MELTQALKDLIREHYISIKSLDDTFLKLDEANTLTRVFYEQGHHNLALLREGIVSAIIALEGREFYDQYVEPFMKEIYSEIFHTENSGEREGGTSPTSESGNS